MFKDFIDINDFSLNELREILDLAKILKSQLRTDITHSLLPKKNLAMIFEKPSTRTRVSFETGINQLGGNSIILNINHMQIGKGESISDTAKVMSRYVDLVMIRCKSHSVLQEFAANASIPVINGLTDYSHPCQIMAAIMTFEESISSIKGKKIAWLGDQNNVLNSYIHAAGIFDFRLDISTPKEIISSVREINKAKSQNHNVNYFQDPKKAAKDADVIVTDTWFSMGDGSIEDEKEKAQKTKLLKPYQVNQQLFSLAKKNAIFSHCLPAYRNYEVTADIIDGENSIVFYEAENRLHIQKAIMVWLYRRANQPIASIRSINNVFDIMKVRPPKNEKGILE